MRGRARHVFGTRDDQGGRTAIPHSNGATLQCGGSRPSPSQGIRILARVRGNTSQDGVHMPLRSIDAARCSGTPGNRNNLCRNAAAEPAKGAREQIVTDAHDQKRNSARLRALRAASRETPDRADLGPTNGDPNHRHPRNNPLRSPRTQSTTRRPDHPSACLSAANALTSGSSDWRWPEACQMSAKVGPTSARRRWIQHAWAHRGF